MDNKTLPICTLEEENINLIDKYPIPINMPDKLLTIIRVFKSSISTGIIKLFTSGVRTFKKPIKSIIVDKIRINPLIIIKHPAYIELIKMKKLQHPSKYTFLYNF